MTYIEILQTFSTFILLTYFMPRIYFHTPLKQDMGRRFLMSSEGMKWVNGVFLFLTLNEYLVLKSVLVSLNKFSDQL